MEKASSSVDRVNGGTGIGTTVKEIAEEVRKHFDASKKVTFNGLVREGDPRFYQADTKRTGKWGWKPKRDWKGGIREYVEWFKGSNQPQ